MWANPSPLTYFPTRANPFVLSILDVTVKAFKVHLKAFLPFSPSPTLPFARFVGIRTHDVSLKFPLMFTKTSPFSFFFKEGVIYLFPPNFLVRDDPSSADLLGCCTYRVDAGNRLPLCEGEVDFICQVPNLTNYQLLINQLSYQ
jgi:hypothetical protein